MRNFGFKNEVSFEYLGTNAKNSEFHAAMGLVNLNHFAANWQKREELSLLYDSLLKEVTRKQKWNEDTSFSYSYYPVIFNTEEELLEVLESLKKNNIIARRYFYPSLNTLPFIKGENCPVSEDISRKILCLPIYPGLSDKNIKSISSTINKSLL